MLYLRVHTNRRRSHIPLSPLLVHWPDRGAVIWIDGVVFSNRYGMFAVDRSPLADKGRSISRISPNSPLSEKGRTGDPNCVQPVH